MQLIKKIEICTYLGFTLTVRESKFLREAKVLKFKYITNSFLVRVNQKRRKMVV